MPVATIEADVIAEDEAFAAIVVSEPATQEITEETAPEAIDEAVSVEPVVVAPPLDESAGHA